MRERDVALAAQGDDRRAREEMVRAYLPLVYNVVGPAVEGVVQETMLRVVGDLDAPRRPESPRAWVLTIAMRQVSAHRQQGDAGLDQVPETGADFEELSIPRLRLSGERRQVAQAARWLDDEDRTVPALWWQEAAGESTRGETAAALGTTPAYAAVRLQRTRPQLDRGRTVVAALAAAPRCPGPNETIIDWNDRQPPSRRKRIDRHIRECPACLAPSRDRIAVEHLLAGSILLPAPHALLKAAGIKAASTKAASMEAADAKTSSVKTAGMKAPAREPPAWRWPTWKRPGRKRPA
jgi:DNA-directed RNA polymerase specialized sigma24 family protein